MDASARASALVTVRARGMGTGGRKKSRLVVARGGKATSGKAKATSSGTRGHRNQKRRGRRPGRRTRGLVSAFETERRVHDGGV